MDTKSGYPFWVIKNGLLSDFPQLERDAKCDVLVIGGGITGALTADHLSRHGHDVIVVEQRDVGWGSTAASTALLQFEIDTPMAELARMYDQETAGLAYTSCAEGVKQLATLSREVKDVGFKQVGSLYLASKPSHVEMLAEEQTMRERYGLPSKMLGTAAVREQFGVSAPAALHTPLAASVDPYRLTHKLLARTKRRGGRVFDQTQIMGLEATNRGVTVRTDRDVTIRAGHVVVAAGYESQRWIPDRVARNRSSYACISDPIEPALLGAFDKTVLWESARPYHYLRSTDDHRILIGGLDDAVDVPKRRDGRVHERARKLIEYAQRMLPDARLTATYAWAGTFAETEDGLPFFGAHDKHGPRVLFAMAYGGNGITYSILGATLLRAIIERREHPLEQLYAFDRVA